MGQDRNEHRLMHGVRRKQAGITAIGFLLLASLFGLVGFAAIKLVPLYIQNLRLSTVLADMEHSLRGQSRTPAGLRKELFQRLAVEGVRIPRDSVTIKQVTDGYELRIEHENRTPFIADIWFVVVFDERVEIRR